jgi:hypothetical protein
MDEGDEEANPEIFAHLWEMLGDQYQSSLAIHLSHTPKTQQLAVRFAYVCCQHWPCVVYVNYDKLFSCEEIERLYKENGYFTLYC